MAHEPLLNRVSQKRTCERIHVLHLVNGGRADDVVDPDDVLMLEAQEDLDLPQGALAVRLVLKRADLLDGHADLVVPVVGGAASLKGEEIKKTKKQQQKLMLSYRFIHSHTRKKAAERLQGVCF